MINLIQILLILFLAHGTESTKVDNNVLVLGEELLYEVKYSIFKLGTIKIKTYNLIKEKNTEYYECKAFIDSYDGLPIVDLHSIYYSKISDNIFSDMFIGLDKMKDGWRFTKYSINYNDKIVEVQKGWQDGWKIDFQDKVKIEKNVQDGLSLFFIARKHCRSNSSKDFPTFINESTTLTTINFYDEPVKQKIDAVDYKVNCVKIDGLARFKGIFGLTGEFEGYFSNDEACIPIKAKMKVILGSVEIELKSWKRNNWEPPKFDN